MLFKRLFGRRAMADPQALRLLAAAHETIDRLEERNNEGEARMYRYKAALMDTTRGLRRLKRKCERQQLRIAQLVAINQAFQKDHNKQTTERILEIAKKVEGSK